MSNTTVLHTGTSLEYFEHYPDVAAIYGNDRYQQLSNITPHSLKPGDMDLNLPHIITFLSEKPKVFFTLMNGPYHFLHDSLGPLIYMINKMPNAQFILDTSKLYHFDDSYAKHFYSTLYKKNIDFKLINFKMGEIIVANNFYYQTISHDCFDAGNSLYKFFEDDFKDKNIKPFRKLYLSRKMASDRDYKNKIIPGASHSHDNRIQNEKKLENFLSDLGFEIIVPEDFSNFQEQINHYHEAKTIVSVTSSALTAACAFMQPRSNVVELINSMIVPISGFKENELVAAEESLHLFYISMAFNRDHNFFAIPNKTREADDIIEKIKNSPSLRSVFEIS